MMSENKEKRVAIYIRVANADQMIMDNQEAELRQYAEEQGYTAPLVYKDNGHSGLSFHRPAFMKMQKDIQNGTIGKIIAKDLSRIGRNTTQVMNWLDELKQKGVALDTKQTLSPKEMKVMSTMYKDAQSRAGMLMKKTSNKEHER